MNIFKIFLILPLILLSGCSVYKASSNEGVSVSDVKQCKTEGCFLSRGMKIVDSRQNEQGKYVILYRAVARKSGANYVRGVGHGAMDVLTLGLWEVVGTPVEGAISNNRGFITAKITYSSKDMENIESVKIYDAKGELVKTG